ncbi:hypothetical protein Tco_0586770 [Tanacetum coccineum]
MILYHEGPSDVKESRVMDLKLWHNTFKFKEGESLTQTFTKYKALMNELVNDGIKLSKLEIDTDFINRLPNKWLAFCQSLRNTNHVKESKLASLFGKLKYEENLIDSIYETDKEKTLISATPLSTSFLSTSIIQDFQDSPDDKEDIRSSKNKGLIAETYEWDEEEVSSNENEAIKFKALMALANEEIVYVRKESASNGEWVKIPIQKHVNTKILKENQNLRNELKELTSITVTWLNNSNKVNQCISEQIPIQKKKILGIDQLTEDTSSSGPKDPVFVKSLADNSEVSIIGSNKPKLFEAEDSTLSSHDTATDYDSADESLVCNTPVPLLEKLAGAKHVLGPKIIKSNLKSNPVESDRTP